MPQNGSDVFVGRKTELQQFKQILDRKGDPAWLVNLHGPGGIGKTELLKKFLEELTARVQAGETICHTGIVDFYETDNRQRHSLLIRLAHELGEEHFPEFLSLVAYERDQARDESIRDLMQAVRDVFLHELGTRADKCLVALLFDTYDEEVVPQDMRDWFVSDFLARLGPNVVVVISGRLPLAAEALPVGTVVPIQPSVFSLEEMEEYLKLRDAKELEGQALRMLHLLSQGRPILVGLIADWVLNLPGSIGTTNIEEVFQGLGLSPERRPNLRDLLGQALDLLPHLIQQMPQLQLLLAEFEYQLVNKVANLDEPENLAILYAAHLYRRFDAEVLRYMFDGNPDYDQGLLDQLARLSFIKYRAPSPNFVGSCLLHDEMRKMVTRHVWRTIDPNGATRRDLSNKVLGYYDQKIAAETDPREKKSLRSEQLFYRLDADIQAGYDWFIDEFDTVVDPKRLLGFGGLLLAEMDHFQEQLGLQQRYQVDLRRGILLYEREEVSASAREIFDGLLARGVDELGGELESDVKYNLGRFHTLDGHYEQALPLLEDSERYFADHGLHLKQAKALNYLGYARHLMGYQDQAAIHYQQTLDALSCVPDDVEDKRRWLGFALGNQGVVLRIQGKKGPAITYGQAALATNEALGNLREVARALNSLGMSYRDAGEFADAERCYLRAIELLESEPRFIQDRLLIGRVKSSLGFLYYRKREWGGAVESHRRHEWKHLIDERSEEQTRDLITAERLLLESKEILEEVGNVKELVQIYNKLGGFYLIWRDCEESFNSSQRSQELALQCQDHYHIVDCWADLAAYYYFCGDDADPEAYAKQVRECIAKAKESAEGFRYPYLLGRVETTEGNLAYDQDEYMQAFEHYTRAAYYMAQFSGAAFTRSVEVVGSRLVELPPAVDRQSVVDQIIHQWQGYESDLKRQEGRYQGFLDDIRVYALVPAAIAKE